MTNPVAQHVAQILYQSLSSKRKDVPGKLFDLWAKEDRMIVLLHPALAASIPKSFARQLSLMLQGRKVVLNDDPTTVRGVYLQIAYAPSTLRISSRELDMSKQTHPLSVPIGETNSGSMWINFVQGDSYLIGGSRGTGKTHFLHGWIQALLHGGQAKVFALDSKQGAEFNRYQGHPNYTTDTDALTVLKEVNKEIEPRKEMLTSSGYANVASFNEKAMNKLPPLAVFVDEAALLGEQARELVRVLVAEGRAWGVHPIVATQRTGVTEVQALVKANLVTRIAFSLPTAHDSTTILGHSGAEKIPKGNPGRLLMIWGSRLIKAQAYQVTLPTRDSMTPVGEDLMMLQELLIQHEGKCTAELIQQLGATQWQANQKLIDWRNKGWVFKDTKRKNGTYITPDMVEWLQAKRVPQ